MATLEHERLVDLIEEQRARDLPREPDHWEMALLRILSEQRSMTMDHLARHMYVYREDMARCVQWMVERGWVGAGKFICGMDDWVWLRASGWRCLGRTEKSYRPQVERLLHMHAINGVRLDVESRSPEGKWVSERDLLRGKRGMECETPDGMVEIGEERHAIEVELSAKKRGELEGKIQVLEGGYDRVIYFVTPEIRRLFERWEVAERHPKVVLRSVGAVERRLSRPAWRVQGDPDLRGCHARPIELAVRDLWLLGLLGEQRAIPADQLGRFLRLESGELEQQLRPLVAAGLVQRARPLANEPIWVWLRRSAAKVCGLNVFCGPPYIGGLERLRALNEVRLLVSGSSRGRWVSGRVLGGKNRRYPAAAVVEIGAERHGIDVFLSAPGPEKLERRLRRQVVEHDLVVWFAGRYAHTALTRFAASYGGGRLVVRALPGADVRTLVGSRRGSSAPRRAKGPPRRRAPVDMRGAEVDDELWADLRMRIPPFEDRSKGSGARHRLPDRVVLSALVWLARKESPWNSLPRRLGSTHAVRTRLRYWEEAGVWDEVRALLQARLADGDEVNWGRLSKRRGRRATRVGEDAAGSEVA